MSILLFLPLLYLSGCNGETISRKNVTLIDEIRTVLTNHSEAEYILTLMQDATTKIPSGIYHGTLADLGDFEQCCDIHVDGVFGKYCLGLLNVEEMVGLAANISQENVTSKITDEIEKFRIRYEYLMGGQSLSYKIATCIPHNMEAKRIPEPGLFSEDRCYSRGKIPWVSQAAIMTLALLGVFFTLAFSSTLYDIVLRIKQKKSSHGYFLAFSYVTNSEQLIGRTKDEDYLQFFDGLRSLTMVWVVACNYYEIVFLQFAQSSSQITQFSNGIWNMFLIHGHYSVDVFLLLSGFLVVYGFFTKRDRGIRFHLGYYYAHRYLRLIPAYALFAIINRNLIEHLTVGPTWHYTKELLIDTCEDGWWSNSLFVENIIHKGECLPQAWYLQVDMQLYIFTPIVIYFFLRHKKVAVGAMTTLLCASLFTAASIAYIYNVRDFSFSKEDMEIFYHQPYTQFGSYVIGLTLGYIVYECRKHPPELKKSFVTLLWILSVIGLLVIILAGYPLFQANEYERVKNVLYISLGHLFWSICVAIMIFLCSLGYGGYWNRILSLPIFNFLSRISYSIYLVHVTVIVLRYTSLTTVVQFTQWQMFFGFWGNFAITLFVALGFYLTFELPIKILLDYISSEKKILKKINNDVHINGGIGNKRLDKLNINKIKY